MIDESNPSKDYHDYVFKGGRLVGQFDSMYRHSSDVPWHQNDQSAWLDVRLGMELLREYGPFTRIHDFGCGLGYFLDLLGAAVGTRDCLLTGSDVSPTACAKASELFPRAKFNVQDLMTPSAPTQINAAENVHDKPLFSLRATLWYVFPEIENVVANIAAEMRRDDLLLVVQNFPPLNSDFIGKDVIPNPDSLVQWFGASFRSKRSIWIEDRESCGNDNWFVGLFHMQLGCNDE
jgi:SAM-dependent methyltransferase